MATTVQSLVTAANQLITDLNEATSYTQSSGSTTSGTAGPLLGDPAAEGVLNSVLSAISGAAGVDSTGSSALVGITMNEDGTLTFDPNAFAEAYDANPTQVANTFTSGGTSSSPLMSFYQSSDATAPGQYQVAVTQAASQATDTGAVASGGTVTKGETLTVTAAGSSASYTTKAGESLSDIATALNEAFASSNVGVNAVVVNGALQLASMAYGSQASFKVTSTASGAGTTGLAVTAGQPGTFTGTDVKGTINGQAATGTGQLLLGATDSSAQGELQTAGGTITSTVNYQPGVAQRLANAAYAAGNPANGTVVNAIAGQQSEMTDLTSEIDAWNPILQEQQTQLQDQYDAMETSMAALKATQSDLTQYSSSSSSSSS
jgi:flagellar hook-associated protein 2